MTKIANRAASALTLAFLAGGALAESPNQPQDVTVMADISSDNAAIDPRHAEATGRTVAAVIEGLNLKFGDRIMLMGVGSTIPDGWNDQVYELRYQGAQPADAPAFVTDRIAALQHAMPVTNGNADIVWAIERMSMDCTRTTTLIVVSNMIGSGTLDGDSRFSIGGVPGTPHAGCSTLIWVGVGLGGDYPKGIVRAAESVLVELGKQIGFEDVSVAR